VKNFYFGQLMFGETDESYYKIFVSKKSFKK